MQPLTPSTSVRAASLSGLVACTAAELADQYTDLLASRWSRRADRLAGQELDFADLCAYDDRIEAALDALVALDDAARRHMQRRLEVPLRRAELFALACFGLGTRDRALLEAAAALATTVADLMPAWTGALAWTPASPLLESAIEALPAPLRLDLAGRRGREMPGLDERTRDWLRTLDTAPPNVVAALQWIRACGRSELAPVASEYLDHGEGSVRLAAAQTLLAVGPPQAREAAVEALLTLADDESDGLRRALSTAALRSLALHAPTLASRVLPRPDAPDHRRGTCLQALGWLGAVDALPTLIEALRDPPWARTAAAAISLITGSDPGRDGWLGVPAEPAEPAVRAADEDDRLPEAAADGELPLPDAGAFAAWWRLHAGDFQRGRRYLAGRPIAPGWLATVLGTGLLASRPLAAEHLQHLTRGPLFPTDLPASAQRARLHELN
ncbi:MAG: hypothetical protein KGL18_10765 [Burkholderiales bacterium]|nr:hypothetical protein [Burkholderiales bacterium]MDE1926274.1 hypothetical protein [Burkholderiales bacterium]MDE2157444.1 hypothetical protein [Burkholderiales bacterium]MDE2503438.1 hypothetical protein [Burkholderiales bacterium]